MLAGHYDLVIVSNVHRAGFAASNERLHGRFAAVITAEDVGAYKPADAHFDALLRWVGERGIERDELLHVAQSLFHDHAPAARFGLTSVWIDRRHDRPGTRCHARPRWRGAVRGAVRVDGRPRRRRGGCLRDGRLTRAGRLLGPAGKTPDRRSPSAEVSALGEELVGERVGQPSFVAVGRPLPVDHEEAVELW